MKSLKKFLQSSVVKSWLSTFFALSKISGKTAKKAAEEAYLRLTLVVLAILAITFLMWILNIYNLIAINLVIFFIGALALAFFLNTPNLYFYAAIAGIALSDAKDGGLTDEVLEGIGWLHSLFIHILFGFVVVAGILSTWSFANAPHAFWVIVAMSIVIIVTSKVFGFSGNGEKFGKFLKYYAILVIVISLFGTFGGSDEDGTNGNEVEITENQGLYDLQVHEFLVGTKDWSNPTFVHKSKCFDVRRKYPDSPKTRVQGRTDSNPKWVDIGPNTDFRPAWIRCSSRGPGPTTCVKEIKTCSF